MFLFVSGCQWTRTGACPSWKGRFYSLNVGLDAVSGLKWVSEISQWSLFEHSLKRKFSLLRVRTELNAVFIIYWQTGAGEVCFCSAMPLCYSVMWFIAANWLNVIYWRRVYGFLLALCIKPWPHRLLDIVLVPRSGSILVWNTHILWPNQFLMDKKKYFYSTFHSKVKCFFKCFYRKILQLI